MRVLLSLAILLPALCLQACGGRAGYDDGQIYCCGGDKVFLIDVEAARAQPLAGEPATRPAEFAGLLWSWQASDSPQIRPPHRAWFSAMDECKPVLGGGAVLVSSSSQGGVALIRQADKKCLFYAGGRNAHSAELIGTDLLAGAFSYRCDELRLYRLSDGPAARPAWTMRLSGAHGVVWDRARSVLWALGGRELLKLKVHRPPGQQPSAEVLRRWRLPSGGGHDLFPLDADRLVVTVNRGVYQFDAQGETFRPLPSLTRRPRVKSVCRHPATGTIMYTQGEPTFTNKIRILAAEPLVLPAEDLYKARWNVPNRFSYER